MIQIDELRTAVTSAIHRAEELESQTREVWSEVSHLEEQLADLIPESDGEGRIARRGAITAAQKSGDFEREHDLRVRYGTDISRGIVP